jgi:hypothetical protein
MNSSLRGTLGVPFSTLVRDTIREHGLSWAVRYYCKRHKLTGREFRIFAGI